MWHGLGLSPAAPFRKFVGRTFAGALILVTALVSVGLTAPEDGPFSIGVRAVFFRLDPTAIAESRAHAFGLDVDIKLGTFHVHIGWSAIPLVPATTKTPGTLLTEPLPLRAHAAGGTSQSHARAPDAA